MLVLIFFFCRKIQWTVLVCKKRPSNGNSLSLEMKTYKHKLQLHRSFGRNVLLKYQWVAHGVNSSYHKQFLVKCREINFIESLVTLLLVVRPSRRPFPNEYIYLTRIIHLLCNLCLFIYLINNKSADQFTCVHRYPRLTTAYWKPNYYLCRNFRRKIDKTVKMYINSY